MGKSAQACRVAALIVAVSLSTCVTPSHDDQHHALRMADAGGHRLHLVVAGGGGPTVVLESGLGDTREPWAKVQSEAARFSKVVAYDRAGLGQSDSGPQPRTARRIAAELHAALKSAGLAPPFILVGHSAGGLYIRVFANMYPDEVAGMVFVDPTPEDFFERLKAIQSAEERKKFEEEKQDYAGKASEGRRGEWASLDVVLQQARSAVPLPDVPVTLLTGMADEPGKTPQAKQLWLSLHNEWLRTIPDARHVVTGRSGHYIQIDEPALVVDAIRQTIKGVEGKSRRP